MGKEGPERESVFKEWAEITGAHGIADFSRSTTAIGKLMWGMLIAVSSIIMIYQVYRVAEVYSHRQWATSIQETLSKSDASAWPAMILCNVNRFKNSKIKEYNLTLPMVDYMLYSVTSLDVFRNTLHNNTIRNEFIAWKSKHNFSYFDIYDHLAPTCEDMLGIRQCKKFNVTPVDTYAYGRCQKIHIERTNYLERKLFIFLNTQSEEYMPLTKYNFLGDGLMMQMTLDGLMEVDNWIPLSPGKRIDVTMQVRENTIREVKRWWFNPFEMLDSEPPCEKAPRMKLSKDLAYSTVNCQIECRFIFTVEFCNCIPYIRSDKFPTCEFEEILPCLLSEWAANGIPTEAMSDLGNRLGQCLSACKSPCYGRSIDTETTVRNAISQQQREYLKTRPKEGFSWQKVESWMDVDDMIHLVVSYRSQAIQVMELYEVKTLDNLVSEMGGLIGIWIGMSFLTVFQGLQYFLKYLCKKRALILANFKRK